MDTPIIFMFSGQGSQYYNMGKELFDKHPVFRHWMNHCSELAEQVMDVSLVDIIYQDRAHRYELFDKTLYTHPAIFIFEYSLHQVLIDLKIMPSYLMGYSMGEFVANVISGVFTLEEGIRLVYRNAELIDRLTPHAGMMAILANHKISERFSEQFHGTNIAGKNYDKHFVVTGNFDRLDRLKSFLDKQKITSQILPVSHGFHSHLMDSIEHDFKEYVRTLSIGSIGVPIMSPLFMRQLNSDDLTPDYFYNIVRLPLDFQRTIEGWESTGSFIYIDAGPAGTLTNFVKQIINNTSTSSLALPSINMFGKDLDSIQKLQSALN